MRCQNAKLFLRRPLALGVIAGGWLLNRRSEPRPQKGALCLGEGSGGPGMLQLDHEILAGSRELEISLGLLESPNRKALQ